MTKIRFIIFISAALIVPLSGFVLLISPYKRLPTSQLYYWIDSSQLRDLGHNLAETRKSILKMGNIIHFPYWFQKSRLPQFFLTIKESDLAAMSEALPDKLYSEDLHEENKKFVPVQFSHEKFSSKAEIRYRGKSGDHWRSSHRSLLLKFPKDKLFNGVKAFDLVIAEGRDYTIELLNEYRLKKYGLTTRKSFFVRLNINNKDAGVYMAKERFSLPWLELSEFPDTSEVFSISNSSATELPEDHILYGWTEDIRQKDISSYDALKMFRILQTNTHNQPFPHMLDNLVDVEKWYAAMAINVVAGHAHSMGSSGLVVLFNKATGKFEPLLEDITIISQKTSPQDDFEDPIAMFVLQDPLRYADFQKVLAKVSSSENLKDDLSYYDRLNNDLLPEFYKDQTKNRGDLYIKNYLEKLRGWIQDNYLRAQNFASIADPPLKKQTALENSGLTLPGSFQYLYDLILSPEEFVKKHPEFRLQNGGLILKSGTYRFQKNVVIPENTKLLIQPGVKILLGERVSVVSYSPVSAIGTKKRPIIVSKLNASKNWGSFALINTGGNNEFRHIQMSGGSASDEINGVIFTGMLAAHNAQIFVYDSEFTEDLDDDAINAKYSIGKITNSTFADTGGDAIDLDFAPEFVVANNIFTNIGTGPEGGDAIDLSFASDNVRIENNAVKKCGDKGISIGERSTPQITGNAIEGCVIGIAVKDQSIAILKNNILSKNELGISLYQKKQIFGGGTAILTNNELRENALDIQKDEQSHIRYE